jgi:hypothetical protein
MGTVLPVLCGGALHCVLPGAAVRAERIPRELGQNAVTVARSESVSDGVAVEHSSQRSEAGLALPRCPRDIGLQKRRIDLVRASTSAGAAS